MLHHGVTFDKKLQNWPTLVILNGTKNFVTRYYDNLDFQQNAIFFLTFLKIQHQVKICHNKSFLLSLKKSKGDKRCPTEAAECSKATSRIIRKPSLWILTLTDAYVRELKKNIFCHFIFHNVTL